ncbi:IclR family transcriptional regulator C-terminal domain-containing protein [Cryobacterium sp. GrIS_2_6]|uniref:IclR family transcriptional regulator domain-containing protein n=1 Tax=Cryobacterium sp. GrIS_2_6 TaxID=3162785 RepID=UPI002E08377F|nr:hypothetical protein [Cryobacterium psychrotolerans]
MDSPGAPRLTPLSFGFHEAAHATAFGKIMLSGMTGEKRDQYLDAPGLPRLTPATITDRGELERQLETRSVHPAEPPLSRKRVTRRSDRVKPTIPPLSWSAAGRV